MDNKELRDWFNNLVQCYDANKKEKQIIVEIRRLIESSGVEVGDEEREKLAEHFDSLKAGESDFYPNVKCPQCEQIRALLRQPKRTVSREQIKEWAADIGDSIGVGRIEIILEKILADFGFEVKEKP